MDIIKILKEKGLIDKDSNSFTIIKDEKEYDLVSIINELISISDEKHIRLLAEFDNYKKRLNKEKESIKQDTKISMLNSILDIDSELEIAINSVTDEQKYSLLMIISKIKKFLEKQNIVEINSEYDENIHEVISIVPSEEVRIINTISKGYMLGDIIIRYPKIILGRP